METIKTIDYEEEMGQDYVDYAMSVITDRALPDVKDGLKPVQRRVLYSLSELTRSDSPHRKCARIVGDTMGKYQPHGDSSIYECLVNMAQSWKLPIPLVDPHGNFGDLSGSTAKKAIENIRKQNELGSVHSTESNASYNKKGVRVDKNNPMGTTSIGKPPNSNGDAFLTTKIGTEQLSLEAKKSYETSLLENNGGNETTVLNTAEYGLT